MVARATWPQWLLAYRRGCFATSLPHDWHWVAEHGLAAPPKMRFITQKGGRCPAAVPTHAVELSSWPKWSECPPAMVLL
jgi:hypothetical protein